MSETEAEIKRAKELFAQVVAGSIQDAAGRPFQARKPSDWMAQGARLLIVTRMARRAAASSHGWGKVFYNISAGATFLSFIATPAVDRVMKERERRLNDINPTELEFLRTGKR